MRDSPRRPRVARRAVAYARAAGALVARDPALAAAVVAIEASGSGAMLAAHAASAHRTVAWAAAVLVGWWVSGAKTALSVRWAMQPGDPPAGLAATVRAAAPQVPRVLVALLGAVALPATVGVLGAAAMVLMALGGMNTALLGLVVWSTFQGGWADARPWAAFDPTGSGTWPVGALLAAALLAWLLAGCWAALRLGLAGAVAAHEGAPVRSALRRSWRLTRGDLAAIALFTSAVEAGCLGLGLCVHVLAPCLLAPWLSLGYALWYRERASGTCVPEAVTPPKHGPY